MLRYFSILCVFLLTQGCAIPSHTVKLDDPIARSAIQEDYFSSFEGKSGNNLSVSMGGELFVMNRYIVSSKEVVTIIPPTGNKFPYDAIWSGTHKYNDGVSGDLIVYTTPAYYKGSIGVILNKADRLATSQPLVQVEGRKKGRRWKLNSSGAFFVVPSTNFDSWALRYGGNDDGKYIFEIVNKHDSKSTDVLQTIYVAESKFLNGFVIRDVFIKGLEVDEFGVIKYQVTDVLKAKN